MLVQLNVTARLLTLLLIFQKETQQMGWNSTGNTICVIQLLSFQSHLKFCFDQKI